MHSSLCELLVLDRQVTLCRNLLNYQGICCTIQSGEGYFCTPDDHHTIQADKKVKLDKDGYRIEGAFKQQDRAHEYLRLVVDDGIKSGCRGVLLKMGITFVRKECRKRNFHRHRSSQRSFSLPQILPDTAWPNSKSSDGSIFCHFH